MKTVCAQPNLIEPPAWGHPDNRRDAGRNPRATRVTAPWPSDVLDAEDLMMISMFAEGCCAHSIARRLFLSERTLRRRARSVCDRVGVDSMIQVVAWAARHGLV